ncbi:HDOD domain-containing protein [Candidatus Magnetominusculus xianensis]|uniref:Histidine kinase n=1 Tax=Candidatus Magnetominusculus xianensis TaxID=1748249 RepID=A0ABR5SIU4_9BACT|nr:HDOD domain-containing protein [Candidatus Magnetominusculus xianensis]KWT92873.1 histidine kinase [Candidatus Magnetominusculus xianensis]MBF0403462.1 HDOD domain-containing protein [Nitrospirota bacterium]
MDNTFEQKAINLLRDIGLPVQPSILSEIQTEMANEYADFKKIAKLVKKDISMSAMVIKVANSPLFLGGGIESIEQALNMLGINNFYNIILSVALKKKLSEIGISADFFEQFWTHTETVAIACMLLARKLKLPLEGYAYICGMFHDCAVPLLTKRFETYNKVLKLALRTSHSVVDIENDTFKTNHCVASYVLAKSWNLPEPVCNAIRYHHRNDLDNYSNPIDRKLASLLILSETIVYAGVMRHNAGKYEIEPPWNNISEQYLTVGLQLHNDKRWTNILVELNLDDEDVYHLQDAIFNRLSYE